MARRRCDKEEKEEQVAVLEEEEEQVAATAHCSSLPINSGSSRTRTRAHA
jgi:hypothetical protein